MSAPGYDGAPPVKERDPLLKFLLGCSIVVGGLAVLVIGGCGIFAWRLMRDETPGRPVEAMLAGDETRYWCFELKPDDAGIVAIVDRMDRVNQETRQRALENTPLRGFPIPTRRADVNQILPLKLELAIAGPESSGSWAGRATVSRAGLRLRAMLKAMRWAFTRDQKTGEVVDVDGVKVTVVQGNRNHFAFANVGNRLIFADGPERLRSLLTATSGSTAPRLAGIPEFHDAIRLEGEDGWAFAADTEVQGPERPLPLLGAVASFDFTADDDLRFRLGVPAGDGAGLATLTPEEATAIARSFFPPRISIREAIELDPGTPVLEGGKAWRIEGRISGLTSRLSHLMSESPSASPTDPSPEPTSDPRSDTPSEPTHGGSPSPAR